MSNTPSPAVRPQSIRVLSLLDLNPCKYGSMEEYTEALSAALRQRGWESILVFAASPPKWVSDRLESSGAQWATYSNKSRFGAYLSIYKTLRKWRPDVLHLHFIEFFSILPILIWFTPTKQVVFSEHVRASHDIGWRTRLACWLWDRVLFRLTGTRIVAVSQHVKKTLVDIFRVSPERVRVILNGVNPGRFVPADSSGKEALRRSLQLPAQGPVVLCASNLRPGKGIEILLKAAPSVLKSRPTATFVILGEGSEGARLHELANSLGIHEHVLFTGLRSDVDQFMAAADIVVTPSVWEEAAGLVVLEGMAAERPVVATRVGGIPEYLQEGVTGVLVEPGDPAALAQAIVTVLEDPELATAMGKAGRKRVQEILGMQHWVDNTLALYDDMLAGR